MNSLSFFRHPSGLIIRIKSLIAEDDWDQLHRYVDKHGKKGERVFIDLNRLKRLNEDFYFELLANIQPMMSKGLNILLIRSDSDLKFFFEQSGWPEPPIVLEYLDEALFPGRSRKPIGFQVQQAVPEAVQKQPEPKSEKKAAPRELRRTPRSSLSLPFLYTYSKVDDLLNTQWTFAVTEELDIHTFSGLGFFTFQPILKDTMLKFVFPTVFARESEKALSNLTVFSGRVKNCISVGSYHRIGVALIDVLEYEGSFEAKETVTTNATR